LNHGPNQNDDAALDADPQAELREETFASTRPAAQQGDAQKGGQRLKG